MGEAGTAGIPSAGGASRSEISAFKDSVFQSFRSSMIPVSVIPVRGFLFQKSVSPAGDAILPGNAKNPPYFIDKILFYQWHIYCLVAH